MEVLVLQHFPAFIRESGHNEMLLACFHRIMFRYAHMHDRFSHVLFVCLQSRFMIELSPRPIEFVIVILLQLQLL